MKVFSLIYPINLYYLHIILIDFLNNIFQYLLYHNLIIS